MPLKMNTAVLRRNIGKEILKMKGKTNCYAEAGTYKIVLLHQAFYIIVLLLNLKRV